MKCPTLQKMLEMERDAWFGAAKADPPVFSKSWEEYSERLSVLLRKDNLEDYLLEEEETTWTR